MSFLLRDEGVELGYGAQKILSAPDAAYQRGERWVLLGANGAGKTTFLRSLLETELVLRGKRVRRYEPREIAYLPQAPRFSYQMPCTVEDFLWASVGLVFPPSRPLEKKRASGIRDVLERTGLRQASGRQISSLSGGQVQRLLLARAFLLDVRVFVLDEPFSAVQGDAKQGLISILDEALPKSLQFFALHDPAEISMVNGRGIHLKDGEALVSAEPTQGGADVVPFH